MCYSHCLLSISIAWSYNQLHNAWLFLYPLSILGFTFCVCLFYIPWFPYSFILHLCFLYPLHQPFMGFYTLLVFDIDLISPYTGLFLMFMVFFLYQLHQPFTGSDSKFVCYISPISPWRVRILSLCSISTPSAPGGFVFSVCALYLPHQPLAGSYSLFVFYIYPISPWLVPILGLCSISIPSALQCFWLSVYVLYPVHQPFTGSYSQFVFHIYPIKPFTSSDSLFCILYPFWWHFELSNLNK